MFLKLARSMISMPFKASKIMNFYGLQNAMKTNEMLRKPPNIGSKNSETLYIRHVLYCFLNSFQRTIWIAAGALRKLEFLWIMEVAKRF
jgi:hypothetical protein